MAVASGFTFIAGTTPATPSAGKTKLYVDSTAGPSYVDDAGVTHSLKGDTGPAGPAGPAAAVDVSYDNTASGLAATGVQAAIDELASEKLNDAPADGNEYVRKDNAWAVATGGGGSGAPWFMQFKPYDNEPPASNYATLDLRNNRPTLDFDDTTQEAAVFSGVLPAGYAGAGVTVTVFCSLTSATTGTVGWDVAFERTQASTDDIDSDSFAAAKTVTATTVPGTSGQVLALSVNVANGPEMDSLAAGELFRLRVRRDVTNDTATDDAELLAVSIKEQ